MRFAVSTSLLHLHGIRVPKERAILDVPIKVAHWLARDIHKITHWLASRRDTSIAPPVNIGLRTMSPSDATVRCLRVYVHTWSLFLLDSS
jgi:hypothetical protein